MNKALIAGTINHLIPLGFILLGCFITDFQCSGTDMSSLFAIYSFGVFPFQIFVESIVLIVLLFSLFKGQWKQASIFLLALFIVSLVVLLYIGEVF
ncbi:hypothetical protein MACH26_01640 [Planctobacterium marinum]|uniref:Uncharacterized protein n=1 Tax=Planctobacterium marinum TaxID=1631968 RepID=A0AA48HCT0_9ALTE|nr:hypothetical protein MACH26_01640 [Planctobacterium marinum]